VISESWSVRSRDGLLAVVVGVDVVDGVDAFGQEAGAVQGDARLGGFERPFQLQHDGVGCEADAHMCLNAVEQSVVNWADIQVGFVHAEGAFYHR